MSTDRNKPKASTARPLMPRLATYNAALRSSPTPRLASPSSSNPPRLASAKSLSNLAQASISTSTPPPPARFTGSSVTPRSAVRKPKPENTQPISTSSASRPATTSLKQGTTPIVSGRSRTVVGGRGVPEKSSNTRGPLLAKSRDVGRAGTSQTPPLTPTIANSFFLPSDPPISPAVTRPSVPPKVASFIRANGDEVEDSPRKPAALPDLIPLIDRPLQSLDFIRPDSSSGFSASNPSVRSTTSAFMRERNASASPAAESLRQRSLQALLPLPTIINANKSVTIPLNQGDRPNGLEILPPLSELLPSPDFLNDRPALHEFGSQVAPKLSLLLGQSQRSSTQSGLSSMFSKPLTTTTSTSQLNLAEQRMFEIDSQSARSPGSSVTNHGRLQYSSASSDFVQSPPTSISDVGGKPVDRAAHARRDRKVLDLEISNSSLLAINSTLEREVRRQKAEIRRFRRLTRTNGLNWLANDSADENLSSTEDADGEKEVDEESTADASDDESSNESGLDSDALAYKDSKHRKGDVRMLKLDLARHREILADSQKLNQSLGRCMGLTEQLIKDANKALSYKVRTSDVQLGGRVLAQEEEDHHYCDAHDGDITRSPRRGYFDGASDQYPELRPQQRTFSKPLSEVMREMF